MGSIVTEPAKSVEVSVTVSDPDENDAVAKVELFEDGNVVETGESAEWKVTRTPDAGTHYWFVNVTQKDRNLLWSAPVWVTVSSE
jgi:hypothetical protein